MNLIPEQAKTAIKAALTTRYNLVSQSTEHNPTMDINSLRLILKVDMENLFREWSEDKKEGISA